MVSRNCWGHAPCSGSVPAPQIAVHQVARASAATLLSEEGEAADPKIGSSLPGSSIKTSVPRASRVQQYGQPRWGWQPIYVRPSIRRLKPAAIHGRSLRDRGVTVAPDVTALAIVRADIDPRG